MAPRPNILSETPAVRRAALYLRVSTERQAQNDVSLPSQRKLTRAHCARENWDVVDEYVEPGVSGTDDRRPAFQSMMDRACDPDHPYDVIVVHAFSRFYRNGAEMELAIRKLRKHRVEVASITQPTGTDPAAQMMRQIIGIFDEYTSRENGKQVSRAMRENAQQGFWNGATPPLGYRIVDAERRGQKVKKKLEIDPVESETLRLIFQLYLEGDAATQTPPLGIKEVVKWLNARGYRTRRGGAFGVGPTHLMLTNPAYVGRWRYNVRDSRTGEKRPDSEVVEMAIPALIDEATFEAVQAKLAAHNPRVNSARAETGPILLTGLAKCAHCGSGMTLRTGTSRSGKVHYYYTCAGRAQGGPTICKGNSIRMAFLDDMVVKALEERVFAPERLAELLTALMARRGARSEALTQRLIELQNEIDSADTRLKRLYRFVEDGNGEMDDVLRERVTTVKAERENARAALERARHQAGIKGEVSPEKLATFARLMHEVLATPDNPLRKAYLRAIIGAVEVDDTQVRIVGSNEVLEAAVLTPRPAGENVQSFVQKWRTRQDSNL